MENYIIVLCDSKQVLAEFFTAPTTSGEVRKYTRITKIPSLFLKFKSKKEAKAIGDQLCKRYKIEPAEQQKRQLPHATAKTKRKMGSVVISPLKSVQPIAKTSNF